MTNPAPLTLLLIRHGQTQGQADGFYTRDAELTELGHRQAASVVHAFIEKPPTALYVSPFRRALQSAEPLITHLSLKPTIDPRLSEIEVSRALLEEARQGLPMRLYHPDHRADDPGETLADFSVRVGAIWKDIATQHDGERIAVVAHGGVINEFLRWSLGFNHSEPKHFFFDLPHSSITEIAFWPNGPAQNHAPWYSAIWRVGDTTHLRNL